MSSRPRLLIATHSAHKLAELRDLLELEHAELVSLDDLAIVDDPAETGETFETNARIKARFGARRTGLPTLADDSGLEVDALDGLPPERRGARYVCVLALAVPPPGADARAAVPIRSVRGTTRGRIATAPRGDGGFGYDPIFEPAGEPPGGRTFGLWTPEAKHAVSHRGRAARRMTPILRDLGF